LPARCHRLTPSEKEEKEFVMSHTDFQPDDPQLAVAYHSQLGHTAVLADAVVRGAREAGARASLVAVEAMTDADWDTVDAADGIVFGSPTFMGNVSASFQTFAEGSFRRCLNATWRDKVAAGFTNSGAKSGDKLQTLVSLAVLASQHHMLWVNLGLGAGWNSSAGSEYDPNRLGFWLGAAAQTDVDAGPEQVHSADVQTCEHLGRRVALVTRQLVAGRAVVAASAAASSFET
jgi:NAD(P)H dehydrogenase (quinone)